MDGYIALRLGLRCVFGSIALPCPDFGCLRGIKLAVGVCAVLGVAAVNNEVYFCRARREFDPGEAPVLILAQEGARAGPVSMVGWIDAVAPQVQTPEVIVIAGGVVAIIAIFAEGVNDGIGRFATGRLHFFTHRHVDLRAA